jgi:Xaa-Pro aminopeptidase
MKSERLDQAKKLLQQLQCSHLLISDPADITYLSGFTSSNAALLISKRRNLILTDFRYKSAVDSFCKDNTAWKYTILKERMYDALREFIPEDSAVGYQSDFLTVDNFNSLKRCLRKTKLISTGLSISSLYIKKTADELYKMKTAASIGDQALEKLLVSIKPGITEIELARKLEYHCGELGSSKPSFDTIVLFGSRAALPHGHPQNIPLKKGDWILIDFGCTVDGFCSDITRTFVFGKASARQREIYSIVNNARTAALNAARSGLTTRELDTIARDIITAQGYGQYFGHALGHGVGLRIHERPRVSNQTDDVLIEQSVITIEPGIYIDGFGGVRIEDMVVLDKSGATELTHFKRDLIEL